MTEHWFIPRHEQQELTDALGEVRDILDDLQEAQKPRIATANWNPKVTTGDRPQPLPFNVAAVDADDRLLIELERWVYWLADARQIAAPNTHCAGYADWLTRNILLLAATPGSEAAHHDITSEIRHARNASGRSHLQPIPKPNPNASPKHTPNNSTPEASPPSPNTSAPKASPSAASNTYAKPEKSCRSATRTNEPPSTTSATYSTPTTPHPNAIGSCRMTTRQELADTQLALRPTQGSKVTNSPSNSADAAQVNSSNYSP